MTLNIYVDGSGPPKYKYGYFIEEKGSSSIKERVGISNNEAEYHAIIDVLETANLPKIEEIIIHCDSELVVKQLNHIYAINEDRLRNLAMKVWNLQKEYGNLKIQWIPRKYNKAGKMLGS